MHRIEAYRKVYVKMYGRIAYALATARYREYAHKTMLWR